MTEDTFYPLTWIASSRSLKPNFPEPLASCIPIKFCQWEGEKNTVEALVRGGLLGPYSKQGFSTIWGECRLIRPWITSLHLFCFSYPCLNVVTSFPYQTPKGWFLFLWFKMADKILKNCLIYLPSSKGEIKHCHSAHFRINEHKIFSASLIVSKNVNKILKHPIKSLGSTLWETDHFPIGLFISVKYPILHKTCRMCGSF